MSVVWPWTDKQPGIEKMVPDMEVWTLRANVPDPTDIFHSCDGNLTDCAWTKKKEVYSHHWFKKGEPPPHIIKMTLLEFLKANYRETSGMNPFWTIGRHEFLDKWIGIHGHGMEIVGARSVV